MAALALDCPTSRATGLWRLFFSDHTASGEARAAASQVCRCCPCCCLQGFRSTGSSHFPCPKSPRWGTPTTQVQLAARPCKLSSMLGRPAFGHHRHSKTLPIPAARVAPEAASTHRWPAQVPTKSEPNLKLNTQSSKGARPRLCQQTLRFCGQKS